MTATPAASQPKQTGLIAFDLEIAKPIMGNGSEWKSQRPLGISCAAVAYRRTGLGMVAYQSWQSHVGSTMMTSTQAQDVFNFLLAWENKGYRIVTVNGAGFDFDVLAEECGLSYRSACAHMAMRHIDLCFIALSKKGHFLGLDAMARGAAVVGKLHDVRLNDGTLMTDMDGAKAPEMWAAGERSAVLEYLKDDVRSTLETAEIIERDQIVRWTSRAGRYNSFLVSRPLPTVERCMEIAMPDNSWMTSPPTREGVLAWMKRDA